GAGGCSSQALRWMRLPAAALRRPQQPSPRADEDGASAAGDRIHRRRPPGRRPAAADHSHRPGRDDRAPALAAQNRPMAEAALLLHGEEQFLVLEDGRSVLARWRAELVSDFGFEALEPGGLTP